MTCIAAHIFLLDPSESDKSKDWEQQINQMKQSFEKQLQSERTLKTQVGVFSSRSSPRLPLPLWGADLV